VESGNTQTSILATQDMSFRQLSSRLSGEISVTLDFPSVQADAGASLALESASDDYSRNWVFSVINQSKSQTLQGINGASSPVLSTAGQTIAAQHDAAQLNDTELVQRVGTDYVNEIEYGSQLFVSMKMDFINSADKQNIGGYITVDTSGGTVSVDGKINFLSQEVKSSVKITVSAHQFGGDPLGLLTILPVNILSCTLDTPTACFDLFENSVKYARGLAPWVGNGFKDQVINVADANVIGYQTRPYDNGSVQIQTLALDSYAVPGNSVILEQLESEYADELQNRSRAQATLKYYSSQLNWAQRTELARINKATTNNAFALAALADKCRDSYSGTACADYIAANCPVSGQSRTCLEIYNTNVFELTTILDLRWITIGADSLLSQGYDCTQIIEPSDPNTWADNYLCSNVDLSMVWGYAGPTSNMDCTQVIEPSDPHDWADNYLCLPTDSSYEFAWAYSDGQKDAHITSGYSCVSMNEPSDPDAWADNHLCHHVKPVLDLRWTHSGTASLVNEGYYCTAVTEPSDPNTWADNYLCSDVDLGMVWGYAGPASNMDCTQIVEPLDPHAWWDNHICLPTDSSYEFAWAHNDGQKDVHITSGYSCISMNEPSDPDSWVDNYLCHREK
jgi:hypothetical protein